MTKTIQMLEQQKWEYKLQGYEFDVIYKTRKSNIVVDELLRQPFQDTMDISTDHCNTMTAILSSVPLLISQLQDYF